jgi:uncharacterized protein (TIGR00369 family)
MTEDQAPPAARLLGRKLISIESNKGEVRLTYFARPEFANRHGTVQGGMLAAMLDSATGYAVIATSPEGFSVLTRRLDTRLLKPAGLGEITAVVRVMRRDEREAWVEAELIDCAGLTVATGSAELSIRARAQSSG